MIVLVALSAVTAAEIALGVHLNLHRTLAEASTVADYSLIVFHQQKAAE